MNGRRKTGTWAQLRARGGLRHWLALGAIVWLIGLYSVQVAAAVRSPHNPGQSFQKCQIDDRQMGADLLCPEAPQIHEPVVSFYLRLARAGNPRVAGFVPLQPKSRDPPLLH